MGRPSTGKSTLVNALCGAKVSIVSNVPQTTRNAIRGIVNDARGQIVFVDTPGFHHSRKKINLRFRTIVQEHVRETDAALYLIDATRPPGAEEGEIASILTQADVPVVTAATKLDAPEADRARVASFLADRGFVAPLALSNVHGALDGTTSARGVTELLNSLFAHMPEHPPLYPPEFYTDQEPAFRISEVLREAVIANTAQEIPHAVFVEVADLEAGGFDDEGQPLRLWARCFIYVERESQKGIVVGKGGANIKRIRERTTRAIKEIFPYPVELKLQVKVRPKWRQNDQVISSIVH